jgi:hypothetical protein
MKFEPGEIFHFKLHQNVSVSVTKHNGETIQTKSGFIANEFLFLPPFSGGIFRNN